MKDGGKAFCLKVFQEKSAKNKSRLDGWVCLYLPQSNFLVRLCRRYGQLF